MKSQLDSNNTNTVLNNIEERLLKENDRNECDAIEAAARYAAGYHAGVLDTVKAVKAKAAEQQAQPTPRTNLDRIRAMSAEKIAELVMHTMECENCPLCDKDGCCEKEAVYDTSECTAALVKWLNSPTKEDGENA